MTEPSRSSDDGGSSPDPFAFEIDPSVAHPARIYNYVVGGDDNFAIDRKVADYLSTISPVDFDAYRAAIRSVGAFTLRAVRYLTGEAGIRQFLTSSTAIPTRDNIHDVAQAIAPEARIVYFGFDPVAMAHAHSLRNSTAEGTTTYIYGTLEHPERILSQAAATLDFARPIALMLPVMLGNVREGTDAYDVVARLLEAVPSGSYFVVAHITSDIAPEWTAEVMTHLREATRLPWTLRTRVDIVRFFDGLEMVEGEVDHIDRWRGHENKPVPSAEVLIPIYAGVGRKP